jgi:AraC-like DNA-binding protein
MHDQGLTLHGPAVALRRYSPASAADVHAYHQVVLGLDGAMEMAVNGVTHRIDHRYACLIPAGERHEYAGLGENRQVVLDLPRASLALAERWFDRPLVLTLDDALMARIASLAGEAARSSGEARRLDDTRAAGGMESPQHDTFAERRIAWQFATQLAAALAERAGQYGGPQDGAGLDYARIDRWLRAHLSEPLSVADLATHCGFGVRRFHQLFDEAFGTTPHRYLQRLRLDTALMLLREPSNTLTDVALAVGFADQSAFTHAFTKRFGRAPGQWRARPTSARST